MEISKVFVTIGVPLGGLKAGLSAAKGLVTGFGSNMATLAGGLAGIGAVVGAGAGAAFIALAKLGSNLEEQDSKFEAVFKDQTKQVKDWATAFADSAGRSRVELEGMASNFQALFVPLGFTRKEGAELSKTFTQLAVDLGSFNNLADEDVLQKLKSGVLGETEPLKSLGIVINDVTLSAKLMELGLAKNAQVATEQQKVMARTAIILASTKDAQGDAIKTSGSLANQWKGLTGVLLDLGSEFGATLIPGANAVVGAFKGIADWVKSNKDTFLEIGESISEAIENAINAIIPVFEWFWELGSAAVEFGFRTGGVFDGIIESVASVLPSFETIKSWIESIVFTVLNWDLVVKQLGLSMAETFTNAIGRVQNFASNAVAVMQWFGTEWGNIFRTALDYSLTILENLGKNIRGVWSGVLDFIQGKGFNVDYTPLTEGAKSAISKMPDVKEFVGTDAFKDAFAELDNEWQNRVNEWVDIMESNAPKIGDALATGVNKSLKKDIIDFSKFDPKNFEGKNAKQKKAGSDKAGAKLTLDSAFDKIQEAALKGSPADKTAENTKKIAKSAEDQKKYLKNIDKNLAKGLVANYA